jgi:cob(I)alamin adenosyltransferase
MGHRMRTYIGQFMKGQVYGELKASRAVFPSIIIEQYGKRTLMHVEDVPESDDVEMAKQGLLRARELMLSGSYDIVVFDEIITAHFFHLITMDEMIETINIKPPNVELIFTGRYAPPQLITMADLVTEMKEVKHYYQRGVKARNGIDR